MRQSWQLWQRVAYTPYWYWEAKFDIAKVSSPPMRFAKKQGHFRLILACRLTILIGLCCKRWQWNKLSPFQKNGDKWRLQIVQRSQRVGRRDSLSHRGPIVCTWCLRMKRSSWVVRPVWRRGEYGKKAPRRFRWVYVTVVFGRASMKEEYIVTAK